MIVPDLTGASWLPDCMRRYPHMTKLTGDGIEQKARGERVGIGGGDLVGYRYCAEGATQDRPT